MPTQKQDKPLGGRQGQQNVDRDQDRPQNRPDQNRGDQVRTDKTDRSSDQDRMRRTDDDDRDDT